MTTLCQILAKDRGANANANAKAANAGTSASASTSEIGDLGEAEIPSPPGCSAEERAEVVTYHQFAPWVKARWGEWMGHE
jgi:hypothetical protein